MTATIRIILIILALLGLLVIGFLVFALVSRINAQKRVRQRMRTHMHWGHRNHCCIDYTPSDDDIEVVKNELSCKRIGFGTLLPGEDNFVWYVGGEEAKLQYQDFAKLRGIYSSWGLKLKYIREILDDISIRSLRYNFPGKQIDPSNIADPHFISEDVFHKKVCESLGLEYKPNSRYLLCYSVSDGGSWDIYDVTSETGKEFITKAYALAQLVGHKQESEDYSGPLFSLGKPAIKDEEDAFDAEMKAMADDVRQKIRDLVMSDFSVDIIERWIQEAVRPSRIRITRNYRIFLTDYGKEIKLKQLPKAVFLFFLKHEEGCRIKELQDYRKELLAIYNKLTIFESQSGNEGRIDQLINPLGTSFIEKCSIIKKAFVSVISDARAKPYYIYGEKGEAKRISLDRSLVDWEVEL